MKAALALLVLIPGLCAAQAKPVELTLKASDKQTFYARLYRAKGTARGVVLMFHQARSNMEEYAPIAPRVNALGFDCLTVDQRAGGTMWNTSNRTVERYNGMQSYMNAYPDMEGALTWAKGAKYKKIIAWGSSYSASLTLKLMSEHPEISAGLVFSPGEYFDQKGIVAGWNSKVKSPVLFAFSKEESTNGGLQLYQTAGKFPGRAKDMMLINKNGIHGSSTLRADRNPNGNKTYWTGVEGFLKHI